jgi:hypothetical protein
VLHTIGELAGHVGVWADIARRRLAGEHVLPRPGENFASLDTSSPARWQAAIAQLHERHRSLARAAAAMTPERLDAIMPGHDHSAAEMLYGIAEHAAYHGGQIALLRNLIRAAR